MSAMKPAYLVCGDDEAKIDAARSRIRDRAEREGGSFEAFEPPDSKKGPDPDELIVSLQTMALAVGHRFLVADDIQRWSASEAETVAAALAGIPAETTVALIARPLADPKARKRVEPLFEKLGKAVEKVGGEVLRFAAPNKAQLPDWLVAQALERGFGLDIEAARLIVERMGSGQVRLSNELDRLALWADGGDVRQEDAEAMVGDDSEQAAWGIADAIVGGNRAEAVRGAEKLIAQGGAGGVVYPLAHRIRQQLAAGGDQAGLRRALIAVADLEHWSRGGSDYDEPVAMTLALREAFESERPR